jgi:hypothetical protein
MPPQGDIVPEAGPGEPTGLDILRALWAEVLADPSPVADEAIHELITCQVVSVRYALLTQLLGKVLIEFRDALSIQRGESAGAEESGRWDARSFCSANVVPWVVESGQVLGTSPDPYVNNPLRRPRLDGENQPVRNRNLWDGLADQLTQVQNSANPDFTLSKLRACLTSLALQYRELTTEFDVPQRISWERTLPARSGLPPRTQRRRKTSNCDRRPDADYRRKICHIR